ncbi:MAG: hypothetical protein ACLQRH_09600 [Acidimicrobiales bacterium]
MGTAGSWLAARRWWAAANAVVASLLVLEPIARVPWAVKRGETVRTFVPDPVVWSVEIFCGCAAAVGLHLRRARYRQPNPGGQTGFARQSIGGSHDRQIADLRTAKGAADVGVETLPSHRSVAVRHAASRPRARRWNLLSPRRSDCFDCLRS